jgi:D-alanyl-D-alanine carboxypeptidase
MLKYEDRISMIHRDLGIPADYGTQFGLRLQIEENDLVGIGTDVYGRLQKLEPTAARTWQAMKGHAQKDGIVLNVVSAFRSVEKQTEIIQKKIDSGQAIFDILKVCAAPGYSEHHTGRAVDITSMSCEPLSEKFEATEAFNWLRENAHLHSFRLSYPQGNKFGISYEPWHWAYYPEQQFSKNCLQRTLDN